MLKFENMKNINVLVVTLSILGSSLSLSDATTISISDLEATTLQPVDYANYGATTGVPYEYGDYNYWDSYYDNLDNNGTWNNFTADNETETVTAYYTDYGYDETTVEVPLDIETTPGSVTEKVDIIVESTGK